MYYCLNWLIKDPLWEQRHLTQRNLNSLLINSVLAILICLIVQPLSLYEQYIEQVQALTSTGLF